MLKRIDAFLIKSFLPPFFLAFLVALFVLIMQTIWLVVDDIMGKGVGVFLILEILGYMCITLFPLALPIGILIASVMVFGNISERYELAAMKSAGISLTRIMRPLMIIAVVISCFSFVCSNYLIPVANLKFKTRLYDIKSAKPTLSLQERIFNDDFHGFTIRVGKKHEDGQTIEDVMIYDEISDNSGNLNMTRASDGKMYMTEDGHGFVLKLNKGNQYREMKESGGSKYPFIKFEFDEYEKIFDLTQFEMQQTDEEQHKEHFAMLSAAQLADKIDSLDKDVIQAADRMVNHVIPRMVNAAPGMGKVKIRLGQQPDSALLANGSIPFSKTFSTSNYENLIKKVKNSVGRSTSNIRREREKHKSLTLLRSRHIYEYHFKYATALVCFVFLFIGSPMGAIIRKGGYGYPLLITILFFMLYMVLSISFKETMKVGGMDAFIAAWLPVAILIPIGILLTLKAMNDSKFLDIDKISLFIKTTFNKFFKKDEELNA